MVTWLCQANDQNRLTNNCVFLCRVSWYRIILVTQQTTSTTECKKLLSAAFKQNQSWLAWTPFPAVRDNHTYLPRVLIGLLDYLRHRIGPCDCKGYYYSCWPRRKSRWLDVVQLSFLLDKAKNQANIQPPRPHKLRELRIYFIPIEEILFAGHSRSSRASMIAPSCALG